MLKNDKGDPFRSSLRVMSRLLNSQHAAMKARCCEGAPGVDACTTIKLTEGSPFSHKVSSGRE